VRLTAAHDECRAIEERGQWLHAAHRWVELAETYQLHEQWELAREASAAASKAATKATQEFERRRRGEA
jgi:hypothetical protein